jgi:hypothetical protein
MSPQGVMTSDKASKKPGMSPVKGEKPVLAPNIPV